MLFSSIHFLFVFLPLTLLVFFLVPRKAKEIVLLIASIIFYAWGGIRNLIYLILSMAFNYLTGLELEILKGKGRGRAMKNVLITSVFANVIALGLFKYSSLELPLGVSFYTFSVLSYIFDVYYGRSHASRNPLKYMLYVTFFPKLVSGPIVQYGDMEDQIGNAVLDGEYVTAGGHLIIVGLLKKALIADPLGAAFASVTAGGVNTVMGAWLGMIFYSLQLYYDFSGYSDIAIGLAKVFGYDIDKNFDHPYLSRNISEFWRRWHISLGAWFKEYVYFPMGGSRVSNGRLFINLLVVWVLTGIWHGSTLNFLAWGLFHGFWVILERFVIKDRLNRVPAAARIIVTDLIAFIGWIFFFCPSLGTSLEYIGMLFGIGTNGFLSSEVMFYLRENIVLLIAAIIGCGTIVSTIYNNIFSENILGLNKDLVNGVLLVGTILLLALGISGIVSNTYSSFLYFKF